MSAEVTVTCFDNAIPVFAEKELDRLYGGRYACLPYFQIYGGAERASTYVATRNSEIVALFLFHRTREKVRVLNQAIQIESEEVVRFARYIFNRFGEVSDITFDKVETNPESLPYPFQYLVFYHDTVLNAPATEEDYFASLGKHTRHNIRRYTKRLKQDFPSFCFRALEKEEVSEQQLRILVEWSRSRLAGKAQSSWDDEDELQRIFRMVRHCGLVTIATIDGKLCGGLVAYHLGKNFSFRLISHDSPYDEYRLGFLIYFMTLCECIRRGGRHLYFGWGPYDYAYKQWLGGVRQPRALLTLYRSRLYLLLSIRTVLSQWLRCWYYTKRKMLAAAYHDGKLWPIMHWLIDRLRSHKSRPPVARAPRQA